MSTLSFQKPKSSKDSATARPGAARMYAIAFDLDTETLKSSYPVPSFNNAYMDIRKALERFGFNWQQGSVYFGSESVDAVTCVLAVQHLSREFSWFGPSVRDIRMLRIEENNDLMPAVEAVVS